MQDDLWIVAGSQRIELIGLNFKYEYYGQMRCCVNYHLNEYIKLKIDSIKLSD